MRLETIVLIVGLLLSAYCLLVAIKPEWFKNFSIIRRDSDGDYRGSTRLGIFRWASSACCTSASPGCCWSPPS